ncbi:hypothetical protein MIR68_006014 [Amoeboaphelidium protococcarum]|nr:hypothetical protein MIR68_006014 [Amoeboaphelidium protococcarum]
MQRQEDLYQSAGGRYNNTNDGHRRLSQQGSEYATNPNSNQKITGHQTATGVQIYNAIGKSPREQTIEAIQNKIQSNSIMPPVNQQPFEPLRKKAPLFQTRSLPSPGKGPKYETQYQAVPYDGNAMSYSGNSVVGDAGGDGLGDEVYMVVENQSNLPRRLSERDAPLSAASSKDSYAASMLLQFSTSTTQLNEVEPITTGGPQRRRRKRASSKHDLILPYPQQQPQQTPFRVRQSFSADQAQASYNGAENLMLSDLRSKRLGFSDSMQSLVFAASLPSPIKSQFQDDLQLPSLSQAFPFESCQELQDSRVVSKYAHTRSRNTARVSVDIVTKEQFDKILYNLPVERKLPLDILHKEVVGIPGIALQEARDASDLYSPRFVRDHGALREGLCLLCEQPHWHKIKVSSYWQHMHWTHGVSSSSKSQMPKPEETRLSTKDGRKEGMCPCCHNWVLVESYYNNKDPNDLTVWWKHIQKCLQLKKKQN